MAHWKLITASAVLMLAACRSNDTATPASIPASQKVTLPQLLERELSKFHAQTGVFVKDLTSKEEAGIRADQPFNSFSVIKLGIMLRAYYLSERGQLNLDERVDIGDSDLRDGSGILYTFDPGLKVTIRDLITQMIITSDNTATDMVLSRVGGLNALNVWLKESGFTKTRMVQTLLDFFRQPLILQDAKYKSLSPQQVFAYWTYPYVIGIPLMNAQAADAVRLQKEVPLELMISKVSALWSTNPEYWLGSMTPEETGRMLEGIETGSLSSKESAEQIKRILLEQREGRLRIPHYLPWPDYFVGHKTGDGPPTIANDVGIVYGPGGPIVISFFSAGNTEPYPVLEDRIGALARAVVDYFAEQKRSSVK